jgi:hypothetical protein
MTDLVSAQRASPPSRRAVAAALALLLAAGLLAVGAVVRPAPAHAFVSCDDGDVCIFRDNDYRYLITAWDANSSTSRMWVSGRDQTTSWWNRGGVRWCAYDDRTLLPDTMLFVLYPYNGSPYVGAGANDRADYFKRC